MHVSGSMLSSPRCGAKTRSGVPCKSPAVRDKKRCRMHGGAKGTGAPKGNKNAYKHGFYTKEFIQKRCEARQYRAQFKEWLASNSAS
jgi:uncharacterized protein YjcR